MSNPWKEKALAFNKRRKEEGKKASDMEFLVSRFRLLPPGHLKKILDDEELLAMLAEYGIEI